MKSAKVIANLLAVGILTTLALATVAQASELTPQVQITAPLHTTVTVDRTSFAAGTLEISGTISRQRFSPRHPIYGKLLIKALAEDGHIIASEMVTTEPGLLPKGNRKAIFSGHLPLGDAEVREIVITGI